MIQLLLRRDMTSDTTAGSATPTCIAYRAPHLDQERAHMKGGL